MDGYAMCAVDVALGESSSLCKAVLDMTARVEKWVAGFSRYHKYTLSKELSQATGPSAIGRFSTRRVEI